LTAETAMLHPGSNWVHICVDMQAVFADDTPWQAPWLNKVLPAVEALVDRAPHRTIFTRFMPPETPEQAHGAWQQYYRHWENMTRSRQPASLYDLAPPLLRFVPPARLFDKPVYSPWLSGNLHQSLRHENVDTLIVTGGETDVCVLTTVLGAIDLGYRVIVPTDAIFGSADTTHDATLAIYHNRFQMQLGMTTASELLDLWRNDTP
jgi:nicotinamidase-related amidase